MTPLFPSPLPSHGTFSGHETFVFRYGWLKKGLDGWAQRPDIFSAEEAMATLGVGKNMVRSIRHWCLAAGLLGEDAGRRGGVSPTAFGEYLLNVADPFLERDGTLWLLHWKIATNAARATTWYWAFNVNRETEWSRESLQTNLLQWAGAQGWTRLAASSLKADVSCFVRTYVPGRRGPASTPEETLDCPLATLGLIGEVDSGSRYRFNGRPKPTLPAPIFVYALVDFWASKDSGGDTLSLREITHGAGSPGRVFRLDEDAVLDYLDTLSTLTQDALFFQDTALIRQVARRGAGDMGELGQEILRGYYGD